jgi:acyl-CoA thioesterase-1
MKNVFRFLLSLAALGLSPASANPGSLDGAIGNIFKFDAEKKSFELLKETEYDPKTETARSRFTVYWTDATEVRKISQKPSFAEVGPESLVTFQMIDEKNSQALTEGKPFIAGMATVYSGVEVSPAPAGGQRQITGRFTPHPGETPTSGVLEVDGKSIKVTLRPKVGTITVHEKASPADLAKGFWQTTIRGAETDGRFVIRAMTVTPLPDPLATDDPKLPRVLIIGDSISMNYFDAAKEELKGVANLHRNEGNAGPSSRGVLNAKLWLGDYAEKGRHWDVIQFNHGLHDLKQVYDKNTDTFGAYSVPMEDYKANLKKEIAILKKTGAKLIWCATTPVPNDNKSQYARRKGACVDFNKAAMEVMAKHPEIQINDLHATVTNSAVFDNWRKTIDVHFYKEEECKALGKAVADAVRASLVRK